jgi:zinc ribbon protein/putative nucleic acid binding protein
VALTKCPDCGSDVSTEAPVCPKCGRPIAPVKKGSKKISTGWGLVIIVVATIWIVSALVENESSDSSGSASSTSRGSGKTAQSAVAPDESRPVQTYTAEQLYAMFHANEIKANKTIGNAIVRFTGAIASIEQSDFSQTPELQIRGKCYVPGDCQGPESWETFRADLRGSELSAAAGLVKGQTITLQCNEVSMPVDVYAKGCVIVHESGGAKSPD